MLPAILEWLVSIGRVRKMGYVVIKVMARSTQSVVEVTVLAYGRGVKMMTQSKSMTKLSGGDDDDEPSLSSRNTLGNGNRNSNSQGPK